MMPGATQTPLRVLIFEDLQCPDCAVFQTMLDAQLLPRFASRVRFEHHDFPLPKHAWARKAAIAARFFDEVRTGLGLEFPKYAMSQQGEITPDNFNDRLADFARSHSTHPAKALPALEDQRLARLVETDLRDAVALGISRTPTVLVNGKMFIETFFFEELAVAIDSELAVQ
jgi:protein-disulfide isomerase